MLFCQVTGSAVLPGVTGSECCFASVVTGSVTMSVV